MRFKGGRPFNWAIRFTVLKEITQRLHVVCERDQSYKTKRIVGGVVCYGRLFSFVHWTSPAKDNDHEDAAFFLERIPTIVVVFFIPSGNLNNFRYNGHFSKC